MWMFEPDQSDETVSRGESWETINPYLFEAFVFASDRAWVEEFELEPQVGRETLKVPKDDPFLWRDDGPANTPAEDGHVIEDVILTGQRPADRRFIVPTGSGGVSGGGFGFHPTGGGSNGQSPDPRGDGQDPTQNCGADEVARQAADYFFEAAAAEGQHISFRERGAFIVRNEDGTYGMSGYAEGPPMGGAVTPLTTGVTANNVVGIIHNHPGGTINPSAPDRDLIRSYQNYMNLHGGMGDFRLYILANDGRIFVYDIDNMNDEISLLEVSGGCS
jgi:hypothetical protein